MFLILVLIGCINWVRALGPLPAPPAPTPADWRTLDHSPGRCAMYGTCGRRRDGDPLACATNAIASPPSDALSSGLQTVCPSLWADRGGPAGRYCCTPDQVDRIKTDTQKALPFILGCPACRHNFVQLWCLLICSPNQATFTNVTVVQVAPDTGAANAVAEVDYWLTTEYGNELYDSCKDVKFGAANVPAMSFIGGGARNGQEWLDFLGTCKDKRMPPLGSPIQINFRPENNTPAGLGPMRERVISCGDNGLRCSCSDCPAAQGCAQPDPDPPGPAAPTCEVGTLSCWVFVLLCLYGTFVAAVLAVFTTGGVDGALSAGRVWRRPPLGNSIVTRRASEGPGEGAAVRKVVRNDGSSGAEEAAALLAPLLTGEAAGGGGGSGVGGVGGGSVGAPPLMERMLQRWYFKLGLLVGRRPVRVVVGGAVLVAFCCLGLLRLRVETDPQRLWVGPSSQAAREKAAYEDSFGPFYRVEQMILATGSPQLAAAAAAAAAAAGAAAAPQVPIVTPSNIRLLFEIQNLVDELEAPLELPGSPTRTVRLTDICYKPFGDACATQSVLQYWRLNRTLYESEQTKPSGSFGRMTPEYCFNHWYTECRSAFNAPMDPHVVLGGFPVGQEFRSYSADTTAFVTTFPVSSSPSLRPAALAWERAFVHLAAARLRPLAEAANMSLSFSTERSVQDELSRESRADAGTVAASYGIMLLYIAVALGSFPTPLAVWRATRGRGLAAAVRLLRGAALTSRAALGLAGVAIVAASVAGALGLVSALGLWCTLIIMEVIPFLVLAVGVDNMFVLAAAMAKQDHALPPFERLALALAQAGPSITLAATCEVAAFALGGLLTSMPAVRNFSLAAAVAVALDFVLQVTVFAAMLVLDVRRLQSRRLDCAPCFQLGPEEVAEGEAAPRQRLAVERATGAATESGSPYTPPLGAAMEHGKDDDLPYSGLSSEGEVDEHSYWSLQRILQAYFERVHAPLLSRPFAQAAVLLAFGASLTACLWALPALQVGLDQSVALPRDSYLQPYFSDIMRYLRVGPPLLLVVRDLDLDPAARQVERVCAVSGCDQDSLLNRVSAAARDPSRSFISAAAASWLDDFMSWLSPDLPVCCRSQTDPSRVGPPRYCPPPDQMPCSSNTSDCDGCSACVQAAFEGGRPSVSQFQSYLPWFLGAKPSEQCAKGGLGAYSDALHRARKEDPTSVAGLLPESREGEERGGGGGITRSEATVTIAAEGVGGPGYGTGGGRVAASSFRTYYRPLNQQADFIEALRQSRAFAARASRELKLDVYAYSLFHVFFEQYLSVLYDTAAMVGLPLIAVVCVAWSLSGSLWSSVLLAGVLASLLVHLGGAMLLAGIQVNAVSLVNLAMALGIAVEFCAHIMHAYMVAPPPPPPPPPPPTTTTTTTTTTTITTTTTTPDITAPIAAETAQPVAAAAAISRVSRSRDALVRVGSSVLSGVTLTKLVGVAVLAFAHTQIFEVYYFRLYLALVVLGAAHGLVLLPVLLALVGPPPWQEAAVAPSSL